MSMVLASKLDMMMVALATPAPLGSWMVPEVLPARFCAVRCSVASGNKQHRATIGIRTFLLSDRRVRWMDGFNIAANLLSRFEGRAMARAVDHARPVFSRVLARSSSWLAYWDGAIPACSTASSEARSLSWRR